MSDKCFICDNDAQIRMKSNPWYGYINCRTCGKYEIDEVEISYLSTKFSACSLTDQQRAKVICYTRDKYESGSIVIFKEGVVNRIINSFGIDINPMKKLDKIIQYINLNQTHSGNYCFINTKTDYPLAYAKNEEEFTYLLRILGSKLEWVEGRNSEYRLTEKGWQRLAQISDTKIDSNQIFVAMPFKKEFDSIYYNGYLPGIKETGYTPFRVDKKEHINKIDDEIIAGIKNSCCLVADATNQSAGVYYEAGFAHGMNLPVIWACKKEYFENEGAHFDTRQYNHIVWSDEIDLKEKLILRIKATLPLKYEVDV